MHPFCNLQSHARTHAILVIGLYELLDPTTKLIESPRPYNDQTHWVTQALQRPNSLSHPGPTTTKLIESPRPYNDQTHWVTEALQRPNSLSHPGPTTTKLIESPRPYNDQTHWVTQALQRPNSLSHPGPTTTKLIESPRTLLGYGVNASFNNISIISWWSENHRPAASQWQTSSHNVVSSLPRLSGILTHNVIATIIAQVVVNHD